MVVSTNQDGFFTHKERWHKVRNARIELSQITGLESRCTVRESHVR